MQTLIFLLKQWKLTLLFISLIAVGYLTYKLSEKAAELANNGYVEL